jgi:hypothetical protein
MLGLLSPWPRSTRLICSACCTTVDYSQGRVHFDFKNVAVAGVSGMVCVCVIDKLLTLLEALAVSVVKFVRIDIHETNHNSDGIHLSHGDFPLVEYFYRLHQKDSMQ